MFAHERDNDVCLSWTYPEPGHLPLSYTEAVQSGGRLLAACHGAQTVGGMVGVSVSIYGQQGRAPSRLIPPAQGIELAGQLFASATNLVASLADPEPPAQAPCATCPFEGRAAEEKALAVEGGGCEMLCHESASLDGARPDRPCVGFYQAEGKGD